ncbi:MAG: UDP-glucose 4-epimerase GalE [Chthoniobacterales bacterium]
MNKKIILVTGGAGYIGSHTCVALQEAGYVPLIFDNGSNSHADVLERIKKITKIDPLFIEGDVRDGASLDKVFQKYQCSGVIHFAGLKAVGESVNHPLKYYDHNVTGSLQLLAAMKRAEVRTLIFSSSAAVYGNAAVVPVKENAPRTATSPYGRSKLIVENILEDLHHAAPHWSIARLRYFNPIGAHPSGFIGEAPHGVPNNLMPYIAQVAAGFRDKLSVFGADYPTLDGTAVRDYVHVMDLAEGHIAALRCCEEAKGMVTVNLGTGRGTSVLQMIEAFRVATGKKIPYEITSRRPGDSAQSWADTTYAADLFNWSAKRDLEEMCRDSWLWQQNCEES